MGKNSTPVVESPLGFELTWNNYKIFFGKRESQTQNLRAAYPHLQFTRLKQVHGNTIREMTASTPDLELEGDGLISNSPQLALCSITADCIPVLMASQDQPWFGALHAGWRGVASKIGPLGVELFRNKNVSPQSLHVWIGPHIQQNSFEVDADVRDQILKSKSPTRGNLSLIVHTHHEKPGKFFIRLSDILIGQLLDAGILPENILNFARDTKTDPAFHSARRDGLGSGRQVSWIARES